MAAWRVGVMVMLARIVSKPHVLRVVAFLSGVPALARIVGYFMGHCGMDLGTNVIAAVATAGV
jgi:hypothetical protein